MVTFYSEGVESRGTMDTIRHTDKKIGKNN